MIVLLLVAGHDTTMSLISTGLWLLLKHPEAADEMRRDPAAASGAIEETLRFMGPLLVASGGGRWPLAPVELHGRVVKPGESVRLLLGSANRDPEAFADPDRFDIHRTENRHVAFGKGLHFCVGAALARVEGQVVLPACCDASPISRSWTQSRAGGRRSSHASSRRCRSRRVAEPPDDGDAYQRVGAG